MPSSATVTAKTGPGQSVSSLALTNVTSINFDFAKSVVGITHGETGKTDYFQYSDVATVTFSITQPNTAVTIST